MKAPFKYPFLLIFLFVSIHLTGRNQVASSYPDIAATQSDLMSNLQDTQDVKSSSTINKSESSEKVFTMVVGALRMPIIERMVKEGKMPSFEKLLKEGAVGNEVLNLAVNKSHAAVISAFSGATPGTHRAITILRTKIGTPPITQDLAGKIFKSEYLWEAAERQGKDVIVFNVPDCWPTKIKKGIVIGGTSLNINARLYEGNYERKMGFPVFEYALAADELFSTTNEEGYSKIEFMPIPKTKPQTIKNGLAAKLALKCATPDREILEKPTLWFFATKDGKGYFYEDGKWGKPVGEVVTGKWSTRIDLNVKTKAGMEPVAFKAKLLSFDYKTKNAKLYLSPLGTVRDGISYPQNAVPEIYNFKTFPIAGSVVMNRSANLLDSESQRELLNMGEEWYLESLEILLKKKFDLFAFHSNTLDWGEHAIGSQYKRGASKEACMQMTDKLYEDLDSQIGRILKMLPANTTFLLMSPHGYVNPWDAKNASSTNEVLEKAGLLIRNSAKEIDYNQSKAFSAPEGEGLVNVNPRNPTTPDQIALRKENLRKAVNALSTAVNSKTGDRLFSIVLPWEDAGPFGLSSEPQADILTLIPAANGGMHGPCYPLTTDNPESDLRGFFLFHGNGIKAGYQERKNIYPEDFAPTAAYLLNIIPPKDNEGRILFDMLNK